MKLALFDLDNTLLPIDSDYCWGEFVQKLGWIDDDEELKTQNEAFYQQYLNQELDVYAYIDFVSAILRAQGLEEALQAREQFMEDIIYPAIQPQARALVDDYQRAGYECILVTSTNDFVVLPIAVKFGFKHLIATNLCYDFYGDLTGDVVGTPAFREGKVTRVEQWLKAKGQTWDSLEDSIFFSDSMNDLPLLEKVQKPIATNPDPKLAAIAKERGWEILELFV